MYDLDNLKLELKQNRQVSRLELVKARASLRTKRRIAEQLEKEDLKALEEQVAKEASKQAANPAPAPAALETGDLFTAKEAANGNIQYRKNGQLISKAEYDANAN